MSPDGDGWPQWREHVLAELGKQDRRAEQLEAKLEARFEKLSDKLEKVAVKVGSLATAVKGRTGMWGVVGGAIPVLVYLMIRTLG